MSQISVLLGELTATNQELKSIFVKKLIYNYTHVQKQYNFLGNGIFFPRNRSEMQNTQKVYLYPYRAGFLYCIYCFLNMQQHLPSIA